MHGSFRIVCIGFVCSGSVCVAFVAAMTVQGRGGGGGEEGGGELRSRVDARAGADRRVGGSVIGFWTGT